MFYGILFNILAGGPYTIFAPNNDAFNKLRVGYWSDLFNQNYTAYVGKYQMSSASPNKIHTFMFGLMVNLVPSNLKCLLKYIEEND